MTNIQQAATAPANSHDRPGGGIFFTHPETLRPAPLHGAAGPVASALAAAMPALGIADSADALRSPAVMLAGSGARSKGALLACLEGITGRSIHEDELEVAHEAFLDHLRAGHVKSESR